jgi:hypothetical protein
MHPLDDPWITIFAQGKEERQVDSDLVPYWIYERGRFRIERHVPALPLSREVAQLEKIKKDLVLYRMVFGQPRQEDLLQFLQSELTSSQLEDISQYRIDLAPQ